MDHTTFFKHVKEQIDRGYVFVGNEEFVKERAVEALIEVALSKGNRDFNFQRMSDMAEIKDVIAAVSTLPFMGEMRLVLWEDPKIFKKEMSDSELDSLKEMLKSLHEFVVLLIVIKGSADKRRKYYKILKDNCELVEFNTLDDFEAARWVGSTLKKHGKVIDIETAQKIVSMVGTSVLDLNQEVNKIIEISGDTICASDLRVICGNSISFDVFAMFNCFLQNKGSEGMNKLYRLLERGDSAFMIIGAVSSKFRGYYNAKLMLEKNIKNQDIIDALGGGFGAKRAISECRAFSINQIKTAVEALSYSEFAIKNGFMSEKVAAQYALCTAFAHLF